MAFTESDIVSGKRMIFIFCIKRFSGSERFNDILQKFNVIAAFFMVYDNTLGYGGVYFRIGGERLKIQDNKVANDNYYLLSLAAIARELDVRGLREARLVLAVGLPIGRFASEKKDFIKYLSKNRVVRFSYEKKQYTVEIVRVLVYPQCYGAVVERLPEMPGQEYVVDIGSWTVDTLKIIDRTPDGCLSG